MERQAKEAINDLFLYKKMYLHLFNSVSDAVWELEKGNGAYAEELLKKAQAESEELFMNG